MHERRSRQAVGDLALLDQRAHVAGCEPRDALRLGSLEVSDVLRARRDEVLEPLIHQTVRRMAEAEPLEALRSPAGLLDRLARRRLLGVSPASTRPAGISQPQVSVMKRWRHSSRTPRSGSCTIVPDSRMR